MFLEENIVIVIFTVFTAVSGLSLDPYKIRGVQIKNKGEEKLWIEITGENSFILPPGQMVSSNLYLVFCFDNYTFEVKLRIKKIVKCDINYNVYLFKYIEFKTIYRVSRN